MNTYQEIVGYNPLYNYNYAKVIVMVSSSFAVKYKFDAGSNMIPTRAGNYRSRKGTYHPHLYRAI